MVSIELSTSLAILSLASLHFGRIALLLLQMMMMMMMIHSNQNEN